MIGESVANLLRENVRPVRLPCNQIGTGPSVRMPHVTDANGSSTQPASDRRNLS